MEENKYAEYEVIGARIRAVRKQRGMSQSTLADKAHLSLPQIGAIELGKTRMLLGSFIRIAEALQVSTDTLLRPDIPQVNHLYQAEFEELLGDCSPDEIESILKIVKEVKVATRRRKTEYDL
ncbi:MAG: helix-turn-helix domain-containing protein [Faecousia sp.]